MEVLITPLISSSIDIISILNKQKVVFDSLEIDINGDRVDKPVVRFSKFTRSSNQIKLYVTNASRCVLAGKVIVGLEEIGISNVNLDWRFHGIQKVLARKDFRFGLRKK